VIARVLHEGASLRTALPLEVPAVAAIDQPLLQELCYGTLRYAPRLDCIARHLMTRGLEPRAAEVHALLLIGLYQLSAMRVGAHTAVDLTVEACRALDAAWAAPLVNAVLRRYLREAAAIDAQLVSVQTYRYMHPAWLIDCIRAAWPSDWQRVLAANNARAPMTLRVNLRRTTRADYLAALAGAGITARPAPHAPSGVTLSTPIAVQRLPDFAAGACSVQDAAAQLAAPLLAPAPGERLLDACAAPGGKTAHLLEIAGTVEACVAIDVDAARQARTLETLARLGLEAQVRIADALDVAHWWDGRPFDRVLIDAPCTGTGVLRRHPDGKSLRRAGDIVELAARQRALLDALWPLLGPRGKLLYTTCSVLPAENDEQIAAFLARHPDGRSERIDATWGRDTRHGRQILPGEDDMDGFFFALLRAV
jgi:16S rRNA (cytosine967-C5)-methyltransferase